MSEPKTYLKKNELLEFLLKKNMNLQRFSELCKLGDYLYRLANHGAPVGQVARDKILNGLKTLGFNSLEVEDIFEIKKGEELK